MIQQSEGTDVNIAKAGGSFGLLGLAFWLLWAWVSGSEFEALGASADEWAELLKTVWTATLLVAPGGSLVLGAVNVAKGNGFLKGT